MAPKGRKPTAWTPRDDLLLYTCHLAAMLQSGRIGEVQEVPAPFPASLGVGERLCAYTAFTLSEYRAPGGTWQAAGSPGVFGSGSFRQGMEFGGVVGGLIGRHRAQRKTAAAAIPRWMQIDQGALYVSQYGFYMHTPKLLRWNWASILSAEITGQGVLHFSGNATTGQVSCLLAAGYAELVFVFWALTRYPRHPQLLSGQWLPPGWVAHSHAHQRPPPPAPGVANQLSGGGDT